MTFQKRLQKFVKPLDLHVKFPVSSFLSHVKFPCFNFLTQIFRFFSPNIISQPGKSYHPSIPKELEVMEISILMNRFPKSPFNSMRPSYFDIRIPVLVMRTLDSTFIEFEYVEGSTYANFEYVYRVMRSERSKRKLKVRIWRST